MTGKYDNLIKCVSSLVTMPESEIEYLKTIFSYRKILKNEVFLKAGNPLTHIGFNNKGIFRYFYIDFEGNDKTKYFILENNFILSLSSLIEKSVSQFTIEALEDCEILIAPVDKINYLIENSSYWKRIYQHILEKTYVEKEKREAEFLLFNAKDRYLHYINEFPWVHSRIKQHYIASYLGITPESLSRIRSQI